MTAGRRWIAIAIALICSGAAWAAGAPGDEGKEFSFVLFTDPHIPSEGFPIGQPLSEEAIIGLPHQQRLQQLAQECLAMDPKPAFVINMGDTADVGWTALHRLYAKLVRPLVSAKIPIFTVIGNHDTDYAGRSKEEVAEIYDPLGPSLIGRRGVRYSFDRQDCHFVILDNCQACGLIRLDPAGLEWLRSDLRKTSKDKRVLLFLHAVMSGDDTYQLVEMLQHFRHPVIFRGHRHGEGLGKWGGVPMSITGALSGGVPKAGSYRVVTVLPDKIVMRTRDFAEPAGTLGPEQVLEPPPPGPRIRILAPAAGAIAGGSIRLSVAIDPPVPGQMQYLISASGGWTRVPGEGGQREAVVPAPAAPGRHFLAVQFTGENGAVVWAHVPFKVPGQKVQEAWARDLGSAIQGAPAIWQDLAFVPTRERGVYALRLSDGKAVWHQPVTPGQVLSRAAVDDAAVYYGAGHAVYARDARTGRLRWRQPVEGTVVAGVTASGGRLYAPAGENGIYCLDARSGRTLWRHRTDRPILMEPAVGGSKVFFGAMDGWLRVLDAATGKEVWKQELSAKDDLYPFAPYWPPVLAGDRVIVSRRARREEKNLVAFDAASGQVVWTGQTPGFPSRLVMSSRQDTLYAYDSQKGGPGLQCLSVADGAVRWRATGVGMYAGLAVGDEVLVRDASGNLGCVEAGTGAVKWVYRVALGPQGTLYGASAFAARANLAVVGTMDGEVLALKW